MKHDTYSIEIYAGILAGCLSVAFFFACLGIPFLSRTISSAANLNLTVFSATILLFCLAFLFFCQLLKNTDRKISMGPLGKKLLFWVLLISGSLFFAQAFLKESSLVGGVTERFLWHKLPFPMVVLLLLTSLTAFFSFWHNDQRELPPAFYGLFYGAITLLIFFTFYTPNIFGRNLAADTAHGHAYFNSVYNVHMGQPYSQYCTSIYGHYALIYKLPMKLLGGSFLDFIFLTALAGALCFLAAFLTVHMFINSYMIRFLAVLAMTLPVLSLRGGYYWQLWPHRTLFPSLFMFYIGWLLKSCRQANRLFPLSARLGVYLLSTLAILWNTESGLVCFLAWAGLEVLLASQRAGQGLFKKLRAGILSAFWQMLLLTLLFFLSFFLVNLYNRHKGGESNSLTEFLFPLLSKSYMTDLLHLDLPLFPAYYMLVTLLFFIACARGLVLLNRPYTKPAMPGFRNHLFSFFLSILGLGQMTYFINRPAYHNLDVIHLQAILLLAILAQEGLPLYAGQDFRKLVQLRPAAMLRALVGCLSGAVLFSLSLGMLIQFSVNYDIKAPYHQMTDFQNFTHTIAAEIPANTYGFGVSIPEIYSSLGWSTDCFTLDFTDLSLLPEVGDYIIKDIRGRKIDRVFTGQATMEKLKTFCPQSAAWFQKNFILVKKYNFGGSAFSYYRRRS